MSGPFSPMAKRNISRITNMMAIYNNDSLMAPWMQNEAAQGPNTRRPLKREPGQRVKVEGNPERLLRLIDRASGCVMGSKAFSKVFLFSHALRFWVFLLKKPSLHGWNRVAQAMMLY